MNQPLRKASSIEAFLHHVLDTGLFPGRRARAYRAGLALCALVGTAIPVAATLGDQSPVRGMLATGLELAAVAGLTLDLALHSLLAILAGPGGVWRRALGLLRYLTSPWGVIDLLAAVPYFVALLWPVPPDLYTVLGLVRFLKLARYSPALETLESVLRREVKPLRAALFIMALLILASSTALYLTERDVNPDGFGSIPAAMWWAVVTLSTLGYGDVVPVTALGKVLGGVVSLLGIGMFALPASILATGFAEEVKRRDFLHTWHMVARVPFLSTLDADQIAAIVGLLRFVQSAPGDVLMRIGEQGDRMYFIVSGAVGVELADGRRWVLSDGDFFGEIALLHAGRRTATIIAHNRCELLALDARDFRHFLGNSPSVAKLIADTARQRLHEQAEFAEAATKTPERTGE